MDGTIYLVGAGPGDPELISVKGLNALKKAEAVLYDSLVSPELLENCKPDCEKIFVGKKPGVHFMRQEKINEELVRCASVYKNVVRLKGGDSYIFGRGHEEVEYAQAFGINTQVVPGISSSISVPALAGIPITKRGTSDSFWIVTGTTKHGELSSDMVYAAQSSSTVIILMGMRHLSEIIQIFRQYRGWDEPVGIIQDGSTPQEKRGFGTLETIEETVIENLLSSPAIIVIGEVVKESPDWVDVCRELEISPVFSEHMSLMAS